MIDANQSQNWHFRFFYQDGSYAVVIKENNTTRFIAEASNDEVARQICTAVNSQKSVLEALKKCRNLLAVDMEIERSEDIDGIASKAWESANSEISKSEGLRLQSNDERKERDWTHRRNDDGSYTIVDPLDEKNTVFNIESVAIAQQICNFVNAHANMRDALKKCRSTIEALRRRKIDLENAKNPKTWPLIGWKDEADEIFPVPPAPENKHAFDPTFFREGLALTLGNILAEFEIAVPSDLRDELRYRLADAAIRAAAENEKKIRDLFASMEKTEPSPALTMDPTRFGPSR